MGSSYSLVRFSDRKIKEIVISVYNTITLSQHGLNVIDKGYEPSVMPHYVSVYNNQCYSQSKNRIKWEYN